MIRALVKVVSFEDLLAATAGRGVGCPRVTAHIRTDISSAQGTLAHVLAQVVVVTSAIFAAGIRQQVCAWTAHHCRFRHLVVEDVSVAAACGISTSTHAENAASSRLSFGAVQAPTVVAGATASEAARTSAARDHIDRADFSNASETSTTQTRRACLLLVAPPRPRLIDV